MTEKANVRVDKSMKTHLGIQLLEQENAVSPQNSSCSNGYQTTCLLVRAR